MADSAAASSRKDNHDRKRKRKYHNHGSNNLYSQPKRGAPGMLLICETGRESKCRREGLEILNYYVQGKKQQQKQQSKEDENDTPDKITPKTSKPLTLEEELAQMKQKPKGKPDPSTSLSAFGVYDTGCRGTVFVLCTLPNCRMIPPIQTEYQRKREEEQEKEEEMNDDKRLKMEDSKGKESSNDNNTPDESSATADASTNAQPALTDTTTDLVWDPLASLDRILEDRRSNDTLAPSSRFVTRMIPIQATCHASPEELKLTSQALIAKYFPSNAKSFKVMSKRRNCSQLTTSDIVETVADIVVAKCPNIAVKMEDPEVTIVVEICQSLCGMAIVPHMATRYPKNFNLFADDRSDGKEEPKKD